MIPDPISTQEYYEISRDLQQHHALFYKFWELGRPVFSTEVDTAAVMFDKDGQCFKFIFNPNFWNASTPYEIRFVICHECLHVILEHGKRTRNAKNAKAANIAADIVVNHALVNYYGFDRTRITKYEQYAWLDTVFAAETIGEGETIEDQTIEFYYNRIKDKANEASSRVRTVDDHSYLPGGSGNGNQVKDIDVFQKFVETLSATEQADVERLYSLTRDDLGIAGEIAAGRSLKIHKQQKQVRKPKWETLIRRWTSRHLGNREGRPDEQWTHRHRRFALLPERLILPHAIEANNRFSGRKAEVVFFMDASGSCVSLSERFFKAAATLPRDKFHLTVASFDTAVYEIDLKMQQIQGGGGTKFDILETFILGQMNNGKLTSYPDAVFVLTDGLGTNVYPKYPDRWHWFITEVPFAYKPYLTIPSECKTYDLSKFE